MHETWSLISEEHRILGERIVSLQDAAKAPAGRARFRTQLRALVRDIRDHFCNEEAAMRAFGVPDCERHAAEHRRLLDDAQTWIAALRSGQLEPHALADRLADWLRQHARESDAQLEAFLAANARSDVA